MFEFITKERHAYTYGSIGKNKAWELEVGKNKDWNWFEFRKSLTRHCDHAGFTLYLEVLGFWINFIIYDGRHWNYNENRYYLPDEQLKEMEQSILEDYQDIKDGTFHFRGVTKFQDDETLSWEERFKKLEKHHLEETRAYIKQVDFIYSDFEEYINLEHKK